ncbi:MAG: hypothetical protein ACOYEV_09290 [Candidatus Nanopelagicales bacterium]
MVHNCGPFPGVREALAAMQPDVDCLTVSATPVEALIRERNEHGLAEYVQLIAGQEAGSKAQHLQYAATGKYPDDQHILLIGDGDGDGDAAARQGVLFYPINPGAERDSWARWHDEALPRFLAGTYAGAYQQALISEFESYLPGEVPWETVSGRRTFPTPVVTR